ncbi:hypothetical protein DSY14_01385 [Nocardiopsis sp. MG754419]|nr:hypothetical protein [Nocardiopsis sp. MG754419]
MGAAVGAVVLIAAIGGVVVWATSGGEYTALPDDCATVFEGNSLHDSEFGPLPSLDGGFTQNDSGTTGSHGELECEGQSGGLVVSVNVELVDLDHPDAEEELNGLVDEVSETIDEFGAEGVEQGEVGDMDLGYGATSQVLWDESSVGERGMTVASIMGAEEFGAAGGFASSVFVSGNVVAGVMVGSEGGEADIEQLFAVIESSAADLENRIPRVAEQ